MLVKVYGDFLMAVDNSEAYINTINKRTWLNDQIPPYELYLKFLYGYFKEEINVDQDIDLHLPPGFLELAYQKQATILTRKILDSYNDVFLADVLGLFQINSGVQNLSYWTLLDSRIYSGQNLAIENKVKPAMVTKARLIQHAHRLPHIYNDNTFYFITSSTYKNTHYLQPNSHKTNLHQEITNLAPEFGLTIEAWVILNNHYHLLFHLQQAENLSLFLKRLHGRTATAFNRQDKTPGRKFWYNYWDRCIRNEKEYWTRFNYIHYNPIKHSYVK